MSERSPALVVGAGAGRGRSGSAVGVVTEIEVGAADDAIVGRAGEPSGRAFSSETADQLLLGLAMLDCTNGSPAPSDVAFVPHVPTPFRNVFES